MTVPYLTEGDIINITAEHKIYAEIPKHFVYDNRCGDWTLTKKDIHPTGEFDYLQGKYVVVETSIQGGGIGHGTHDEYPNGYYVTCQRVHNASHTISFYQSGAFTAMILPGHIDVVGKSTVIR